MMMMVEKCKLLGMHCLGRLVVREIARMVVLRELSMIEVVG